MSKFKQFIDVQPPDYGDSLKVSGFFIANELDSAPLQEPFPYNSLLPLFSSGSGISSDVRVASGEFFIGDPLLRWNLVNPADGNIFSPLCFEERMPLTFSITKIVGRCCAIILRYCL